MQNDLEYKMKENLHTLVLVLTLIITFLLYTDIEIISKDALKTIHEEKTNNIRNGFFNIFEELVATARLENKKISEIINKKESSDHITSLLNKSIGYNIKNTYILKNANNKYIVLKDAKEKYNNIKEKFNLGFKVKNGETFKIFEYGNNKNTYMYIYSFEYLDEQIILVSEISNYEYIEIANNFYLINNYIFYFMISIALFLIAIYTIDKYYRKYLYSKSIDPLTKMFNRNYLSLMAKKIENNKYNVILVDIDHFKKINENYGHNIGDLVITKISNIINTIVDTKSIKIRYAGEEFLIFVPEKNAHFSHLICADILNEVRDIKVLSKNNEIVRATVSIGLNNQYEPNLENMVKKCDLALQKAKSLGKNQVISTSKIDTSIKDDTDEYTFSQIQKFIYDGNIFFMYQPIQINTEKGSKYIYEALVRLKDDKGNILMPFQFLSFIKDTFLEVDFTRIVLEKNIEELIKNQKIKISINIENYLLTHYKILKIINGFYDEHPELTQNLMIELLETDKISSYEDLNNLVKNIKQMGYLVAIDDFGSGYSNFSHILKLNVDYIKIDGDIIKEINNDKVSLSILKAIKSISNDINVPLIAEYISDKDIQDSVKNNGVENYQGFFISKPSSLKEIFKNFN